MFVLLMLWNRIEEVVRFTCQDSAGSATFVGTPKLSSLKRIDLLRADALAES